MGLFDAIFRFRAAKSGGRAARAAQAKELAGDLGDAVDLYLKAELHDDAARVLLLRADAESAPEKRMAFCASAARTASSDEVKKLALGRKAVLAYDLLRGQGGAFMQGEMLGAARDLEAAGELERAAEAYALAGDSDSEVRALTAAGAIERLEKRLGETDLASRDQRDRDLVLRKIADLERTAERRAALELSRTWLASHDDERVADAVRSIRARLLRGPIADLEIDGASARYALGNEVTIGRGDATIAISSRAISRKHLVVKHDGDAPVIADLDTRNGTTLAGARITSAIPVGSGVRVELGGEIPCVVRPHGRGVVIEVGGDLYLAPLGDLVAGPWRIRHESAGDEDFVVLATPDGATRPFLGDYELSASVELASGDLLRAERAGPTVVRVKGGSSA